MPCSYATGLLYKGKGLAAAFNATRSTYRISRNKRAILGNLGAGLNLTQIAQAACGVKDITDPECVDVLLLALTPSAYSSNNPADTPGRRGSVSPAQNQDRCFACVGFALTAAAEAAINVYKQQSWQKLNLSEQDLSFCKLYPRASCDTGAFYDDAVEWVNEGRVSK
uniref:Peptidase C1A papain C-terminal domain-containing protein n=1 Tax=Tetradesmus obliquus TaxID=3088 RepID=A0A383W070_TETOB|eukprot:jgi/Sobl393_1/5203/SZX71088.1